LFEYPGPVVLATLVSALSLSFLLSHLYRVLAIRSGIVADVNWRSAHQSPTPTGSGIVLVMLFLMWLSGLWLWGTIGFVTLLVCLSPCLVGVIGYVDDRESLSILVRFPVYLFAAGWCMFWLDFPDINFLGVTVKLEYIGFLFGTISLLWLQNLFNFMDGIDGMAAAEVVFVCFSVTLLSAGSESEWHLICALTGAIALGYLFVNWPDAKMFMGDAGSSFFGLMLGVMALTADFLPVWVWMILLCQFIVDACLTITVRLLSGQKIYKSHNLHAYQHLNRRFGTIRTLVLSIGINVIWLLPMAAMAFWFSDFGFVLLLLAALPLIIKDWICGAGCEAPVMEYLKIK
jgi:Fuc2NAc and GlcNAc transferase